MVRIEKRADSQDYPRTQISLTFQQYKRPNLHNKAEVTKQLICSLGSQTVSFCSAICPKGLVFMVGLKPPRFCWFVQPEHNSCTGWRRHFRICLKTVAHNVSAQMKIPWKQHWEMCKEPLKLPVQKVWYSFASVTASVRQATNNPQRRRAAKAGVFAALVTSG